MFSMSSSTSAGNWPAMTVRAPIVGTGDFHRAHGGQHGLGAQLVVVGLLAARTSHGALFVGRRRELEQSTQRCGARPVQGRAHGHLRGFQIEAPRLAPILKNDPQEPIYFARDLLPDRLGRFFSCSLDSSSPSSGRNWQIFSLTSTRTLTQRLKLVELGHLSLRLAQGGRAGERLRDRLALDLTGQTKIRSMARMPRLMAAAVGLPAPTRGAGNGTWAKVAELSHLLSYHFTPLC